VDLEGVDPTREQPFSGDIQPLYAIVEDLQAGGDTPLYDAAYKAVRWAAAEPEGNRAVLLLSDGKEDAGTSGKMGSHTANEDTAIREANRANVPVFTIGLGRNIDEPYLRRLALETGGVYQKAPDSALLVDLFQNVADLLKQQVRITYESGAAADGQEHTVRIEVRSHERVASDEAAFQAPLLQSEATEVAKPSPTPVPAPSETAVPEPTAAPTAAASPTITPSPTPAASGGGWTSSLLPWLAGLGGLGLLLALGLRGVRLRQRRQKPPSYHCLRCGHELESEDAPCPSCGYQGSFRPPERKE